ncbi:hypothetical protein ALC56_08526 [Trachymyrmex septentrionalis]|uniref:Uncharacterized protein n=1 Tax=Trachymyrmex septentrionalis TaxID=34720 RepID=A0A195F7Z3_9HYME|nr:hypothetical protein ALC56_08526 [Trachymyrmex septentrionalis]
MRIVFRVVHERQTGRKPGMLPYIRTGGRGEGGAGVFCLSNIKELVANFLPSPSRPPLVQDYDDRYRTSERCTKDGANTDDDLRQIAGLERVRRVCKRRAARGGCTAPTFRGEAGDPIAMHHPVLYQQLPAIAAPTRPPRNFSSLLPSPSLSLSLSLSLSPSLFLFLFHRRALSLPPQLVLSRFVFRPRVFLRSVELFRLSPLVVVYLLSLP